MKLYPHIVLITALAVPAFCQKASPFPEPKASADAMDSLAAQSADLEYQAAKLAMDAKTLAGEKALSDDQIQALKAQTAILADHFDSDRFSILTDKAAAIADQFSFDTIPDIREWY
jgi:hypothetical protein